MNDTMIKTWWSKELAEHLDIGGSTLRKWSLELEKGGYIFLRDEHGRRAYVEHDAIALRHFKKMVDNGSSYDSATKSVVARFLREDSTDISLSAKQELPALDQCYKALESKIHEQGEQINQLLEMNRMLLLRLDERDKEFQQLADTVMTQRALSTSQEEREKERDDKLSQILKEIIEAKQQAAAAAAAAEASARTSIWKRLLGK